MAGPENWMWVRYTEKGKFPQPFVSYMIAPCWHCAEPVCATIGSHNAEVTGLRREIDSLKGIETPEDTDDTQKLASDGLAGDQAAATSTFSIDSKADEPTDNPEEKKDENQ